MSRFRKWFTCRRIIVTVVVLIVGWFFSAYPRGMLAAWLDRASGRYEIKILGELEPDWVTDYQRLLKDRYGVVHDRLAGCVVTQDELWYVEGYNSISEAYLLQKFGKDIFTECANEVRPPNRTPPNE